MILKCAKRMFEFLKLRPFIFYFQKKNVEASDCLQTHALIKLHQIVLIIDPQNSSEYKEFC